MKKDIGKITWFDLTVPDAENIQKFYTKVTGWKSEPVIMGDYNDFNMIIPDSKDPAAGICHARGGNAGLPPQWLIYINVENLDKSIEACKANGGEVILNVKTMSGYGRYSVIKDPAGAAAALFEPVK